MRLIASNNRTEIGLNEPRSGKRSVAHGVSHGNPSKQCRRSRGGAKHDQIVVILVPPLRGYLAGHNPYPRLAPWATDLSPLRGCDPLTLTRMPQRQHFLFALRLNSR